MHVTLGIPVSVATFALPYLASTSGDFAKAGVDVDVKILPSAELLPALAGGSLQFGISAAPQFDIAALKSNIRLVAEYAASSNEQYIVGPGIGSVGDLKGKAIAASAPGSSTDVLTRYMLEQHGVPATSLHFVALAGAPLVSAAWKSGTIQGTVQSPPGTALFLSERPGSKTLEDFSPLSFTGAELAANLPYMQAHRSVVLSVIKGLNSALQTWWSSPSTAGQSIISHGGSAATAAAAYASTTKVFAHRIQEISLTQEQNVFKILQQAYDPADTPSRAAGVIATGYVNAALGGS